VRLPDADSEPPDAAFWPPLAPDKLTGWQIGDPDHFKMRARGVQIEAGTSGNLLLTRRGNYKKCLLKLTLAASKGTKAFLALRAHFGPHGWQAATVRIYDRGDGIRVGKQSRDFDVAESGQGAIEAAPGKPFQVTFQIDEKNVAQLKVKQRDTPSVKYDGLPRDDSVGAVGVFVQSGGVLIERLDVPDL